MTVSLCQVEIERGGNGRRRTCTADICAAGARTDNSAIAKRVLHPRVLRRREYSARGRDPAQRFKLADVSCIIFEGQN